MAEHLATGKMGEQLAAEWIIKQGYSILHTNWRFQRLEIDIIAQKKQKLHIIEVKARKESNLGFPEDSVTLKKFKNLQTAADAFLQSNLGFNWLQYDVLTVTFLKNGDVNYYLLEDVFYY